MEGVFSNCFCAHKRWVLKVSISRVIFFCQLYAESPEWLGYFGNHLKPVAFRPIREFQKVNHFPGSFQLGRKDKLWSNLCRLKTQFGHKTVDFVPRTFCLPCDARLLKEVWSRQEVSPFDCPTNVIGQPNRPRWIVKPPACARGIGVRVIRQWSDIPKQRHSIVQSYISRPYLINDTKFDLRLYVYVSGFNPLKAYLHRNGLVRFASLKYSTSVADISNRYVHLTNYSVNKRNKHNETGVADHKWKLETLWRYLLNKGINVEGLWLQLKDIVFKTLVSVTNSISIMVDQHCRRRACVHELFGFDILLDENMKPWLLEVNVSPSLHTNTSLDNDVKSEVVTDMFNVAGFRLPPEHRTHNAQRTSSDEPTPTTTSVSTNEIISELSISLLTTRTQLEDSTVASSIPQSRTRTPIRSPQYMKKKPKTPIHYSVTSRDQKGTDQPVNFGINAHFPVSDPRLWDVTLSWDERQKHIFHSRLVYREELSRNATEITKGHVARLNRLARPTLSSFCAIKSSVSNRAGKRSDLTTTEELHNIVSHLTPDDVRTLVDLVDERYRAALGNFEPVFPVAGESGLQLLLFLANCKGDNYAGHLGSRTPTFHYYDVLQYAFLTVYRHPNPQPSTFVRVTPMDTSTAVQLPDYQMLLTGVLSSGALSNAAEITDICTEGITRLTELCRNGFHLSGTEAANQRTRWNQAVYAVGPRQHQSSLYSKPSAGECTVTKTRTAPQVNRAAGDVIESILDGEVLFRAQTGTLKKNCQQPRSRYLFTEASQRNVSATAREDSNSNNQFNSAAPLVSVRDNCGLPVTVCTFRGSVPHSQKSFVKRANFGGQERTSLAVPCSTNGDSDSPTGLNTLYWQPRIFSAQDGITSVPNSGPLNRADATGSSPCESWSESMPRTILRKQSTLFDGGQNQWDRE
ncbi:tubulin polyglutamylase TTLL4 [Paragonimus westermani]|uniref:Tubulin polyglutamylase TTLL4 n=1 Tax=Paragonimus westermani TaxID=34504 RepID=A0A5J4NRK9_9TREM|nr:tubulin polyglutamylase TTLL4 [Paragonimus westermani]